jgi:hypothetical protein
MTADAHTVGPTVDEIARAYDAYCRQRTYDEARREAFGCAGFVAGVRFMQEYAALSPTKEPSHALADVAAIEAELWRWMQARGWLLGLPPKLADLVVYAADGFSFTLSGAVDRPLVVMEGPFSAPSAPLQLSIPSVAEWIAAHGGFATAEAALSPTKEPSAPATEREAQASRVEQLQAAEAWNAGGIDAVFPPTKEPSHG